MTMKTKHHTKTGITRLSLAAAMSLLFVLGNAPTAEAAGAAQKVSGERTKQTRSSRDRSRQREPAQTRSSNARNTRREAARETIKRRAKEREAARSSRTRRGQRHSHIQSSDHRHQHRRGLHRSSPRDSKRRTQHVVYGGQNYSWVWISGAWFNNYWRAGFWQLRHCPHHPGRR